MADQLPTDVDALQALLAAALAERDAAVAERDQALSQNDRLRHLLRQLQRAQFGRRSEKPDREQLFLALEDVEQAVAATEAAEDKNDPAGARTRADQRRRHRGALPAHLPRVDVTIEPEDTSCPCCGASMHVIGEETSQRLDVIPAQFRVIRTHRPKYACRACTDAVVQAPAPERLIKSLPPRRRGAGCRPRRWSPMCWSPNTPGICRCIGRARCCLRRASTSSARCWRSGSAMRLRSLSRCGGGCASLF